MDLNDARREIDRIDGELTALFTRRLNVAAEIADYKKAHSLPVYDAAREREKLRMIEALLPEDLRAYGAPLYGRIFELTRDYERALTDAALDPIPLRGFSSLRCGLLGETLTHSYSPALHARLGDYSYQLFEVPPDRLSAFLADGPFDALNVTIPYKKAVIPYCAALSEDARRLGSVNTLLRRSDGTLYGDNTDVYGFSYLLRKGGVSPAGRKALVFGSGGASAAVCDVLRVQGAREVVVISRSGPNDYAHLCRHADAEILVNATPLGMYPETGVSPVDLACFPRCQLVLDLVYNPARTAFLLQAETFGIPRAGGLSMLAAQAVRSAERFTGATISSDYIDAVERFLSRKMQNIILIGMPGCGKSTVAAALGQLLGREVFDCDEWVSRAAGMSIPALFAAEGEAGFRRRETGALRALGKRSGAVIATGGGCVTRPENYDLLHQNGLIVYLRRDLSQLSREGRPLFDRVSAETLNKARAPLYRRFADCCVENDGTIEDAARRVASLAGL